MKFEQSVPYYYVTLAKCKDFEKLFIRQGNYSNFQNIFYSTMPGINYGLKNFI